MTRRIALRAEILAAAHQTRAEELLPVAVHRHAGGERILAAHQPAREAEPVRWQIGRRFRQHGRSGRGDPLAGLVIRAAHEDESRARLLLLLHHQRGGDLRLGGRELLAQGGRLIAQPSMLGELRQTVIRELLTLGRGPFRRHNLREGDDALRRDPFAVGVGHENPPSRGPAGVLDADRDDDFRAFERGFELKKGLRRPAGNDRDRGERAAVAVERLGMRGFDRTELRLAGLQLAPLEPRLRIRRGAFDPQRGEFARRQLGRDPDVVRPGFLRTDRDDLAFQFRRLIASARFGRLERPPVDRRGGDLPGPGFEVSAGRSLQPLFDRFQPRAQRGDLRLQLRSGQPDEGRRVRAHRVRVEADPALGHVMEERLHRVEVLLRERVVLVVVAPAAVEGLPHPHRGGGLHAVGDVFGEELLRDDAAFLVQHVVAMEARGDLLVEGGIRQQVARELLDGEPVEGHVRIERTHHPVAPRPQLAVAVHLVAVRVRVARRIQPGHRHVLPEGGLRQEVFHHVRIRLRRGKPPLLLDRGRQSREIERHAPHQRGGVRAGRWLQPVPGQLRPDEFVDAVASLRLHRRHERPMRLIGGGRRGQ